MKRLLLILVVALAFILRFGLISRFPVGFNADEASFGYDAYSILHAGRDQWGNLAPVVLKSFGDYKSVLLGYLIVPSVAVFGLNEFAVRLPNVIIGTLAILSVYLLVQKIGDWRLALTASLLLAVNPWAVMMSRGAFEANLITFFLPMGIYFFLKGLEKPKFLIYSSIFLGLNLFTYHSATLITPLVILGLTIVFWNKLKTIGIKKLTLPVIIIAVFISLAAYAFSIGGGARVSERSITQGALEEGAGQKISLIESGTNPILAKILHNKYQVIVQRFVDNYSQYFSYKFLLIQGSSDSYYGMFPGIGVVYIFEVFLLIGLIPFLVSKSSKDSVILLTMWLLIAPLPAALSTGAGYSGNRAEGMIPALQILEAFGFFGWTGLLINIFGRKVFPVFMVLLGLIVIWNVSGFIKTYTQKIPHSSYQQMLDGNLEAAKWINENENGKKIIVSRSFSEPQIFFAFTNEWDPLSYQGYTKGWNLEKENVVWVDQLPEYNLGNYIFKSVDWKSDTKKGTVVVGRPDDFPKGVKPDKIFYYSDGTQSLYVKNF